MFKNKVDLKKSFAEAKDNNFYSHVYDQNGTKEYAFTIKDNFSTSDAPTTSSSKFLDNFQSNYDSWVYKQIKDSGCAIVGKTDLDELGMAGTGLHSAFGKFHHPSDETRIIGGSSSGAIGSLTKNINCAIGSDTGNSVRMPASFNGKVGFKPSYGAVSRYGLFSFSPSLDTVGWMTHNVHDSIIASQILFVKDPKDLTNVEMEKPKIELLKPKKVAFIEDYDLLSPTIKSSYLELKEKLISDGVEVEVVTIPKNILDSFDIVYSIISYSEVASQNSNLSGIPFGNRVEKKDWSATMEQTRLEKLGDMVKRRMTLGSFFLLSENQEKYFNNAKRVRRLIKEEYEKIFKSFDIIIFPTSTIAPKIKDALKDDIDYTLNYSCVSNLIGTPSISIPYGKEENMPFGFMADGPIDSDNLLLSYALYLEKIF